MKKSITSLDLNLLLCLQLLMQERSVTKTAKRMNVTPSAVSKSLAKLRGWFDDPLFVKTPLGLLPTPLAVSMERDLAEWMQIASQIVDKSQHETPSGLKFTLVAESPLLMIGFNDLSQQIYQRYPEAQIKIRNWDYDAVDAIIRGEVDIGFAGRESHPRSREQLTLLPWFIDFEVLFTDLPCVWLREDHPALQEPWSLDTFLKYRHISICWEQSDTWALDEVLREIGRERNIALSLPGFEQSMFMAAQPNHTLLSTAPRYCQQYNQQHNLRLVSLPIPIDPALQQKLAVPFTLLWHKRNSHNPKIVWLKETLSNLYRSRFPTC
ncbi:DNA-binding transcriptional LysR family regulator [Yokenella regensburgei]|uniref:HTH-type transcriptional regulator YidZ n=1 Tax=Yokenella regensburgei TaxID=158877 RepID=A0ABX9RUF5_9ENTR|nr:HTH-type transcriptional regulator YidZ [Yokenella regensburgei]RKR53541.1 DNA-binding transcriptional LysR family regulator [Yokenella regensburgei]VFS32293.1 HTH-type transcriptional regulator yidZ [Yokenella regensburgei]